MSQRKQRETKQQPNMLPGPAVPGCCLVSFCFLCDIHWIPLCKGILLCTVFKLQWSVAPFSTVPRCEAQPASSHLSQSLSYFFLPFFTLFFSAPKKNRPSERLTDGEEGKEIRISLYAFMEIWLALVVMLRNTRHPQYSDSRLLCWDHLKVSQKRENAHMNIPIIKKWLIWKWETAQKS